MIEQHDDGITILRLAYGKANALDIELLEALESSLQEVERSSARAVVLTGKGSIFCAGVDLFRLVNEGPAYVQRFFPLLIRAIRQLFLFPRPIVAAANGHAIAGGCILVASCDHRIMAAGRGRIGIPELIVGVPFPALVLEIIRFALPPQHLQQVVYSGQNYSPEEALAKGIIDEVVAPETLEPRALEVARQLASLTAKGFQLAKSQLRNFPVERAARLASADTEALSFWSAQATHDHIRQYLDRTVGRKE